MFGCSAAIAATGLVTEWLEGASLEDARRVTADGVVEQLALPEERAHVAGIAVEAAQQAVRDVSERAGQQS